METPSFSIKLINIFVGLFTKNKNRFLKIYSEKIDRLGYELVEIEPVFNSVSGKVNPEAIAHSPQRKQSLQVEWTEKSEPPASKISQIQRYSKVKPAEIKYAVDTLPNGVSTWLIAADHCERDYFNAIAKFPPSTDSKLMLCSFGTNSEGSAIQKTKGNFCDLELSNVIGGGILIKRIPYDYVKLDLNNLRSPKIVELTIRQLVNFHASQKHEFTSEEVAAEAFGAWEFLSEVKKRSLKRRVLRILNKFSDSVSNSHMERVLDEPPTWVLGSGLTLFLKETKKYLQEFSESTDT